MKINIQLCHELDFPVLIKLWEKSVHATHHFVTAEDIIDIKQQVLTQYFPSLILYKAVSSGEIVGFIGIDEKRIEMLFILPEHRGKGIGKKLLDYAIDYMAVDELEVNEQNDQAVGFYQKMGFAIRQRYDRDHANRPYPLLRMKLKCSH